MNLILEILEGPAAGRRISLHSGQELVVGRTEYADFVVPNDLQLSSKHFRVSVSDAISGVLDLQSTNGTFLNDEKVTQDVLRHNDIIRAGTTKFRVVLPINESQPENDPGNATNQAAAVAKTESPDPISTTPVEPFADVGPSNEEARDAARRVSSGTLPSEEDDGVKREMTFGVESAKIEVVEGPAGGRNIWLRHGQVINVGRTEKADFVVATDSMLSGVHFQVECTADYCTITSKSQTNPTLVNGEEIEAHVLKDGDNIKAGSTKFRVTIVFGSEPVSSPLLPAGVTAETAVKVEAAGMPKYSVKDCHSGISVFRPVDAQQPPVVDMLESMAGLFSVCTVIDPGKLEQPLPPDVSFDYVFDWLPKEVIDGNSPVMLTSDLSPEVLQSCWGKDALICFLSTLSRDEVLAHLRSIARYDPASGGRATNAVLACFWPSILEALLTNSLPETADHLIAGLLGALVENAESGSWQVFARDDFAVVLDNCGLEKVVEAEPKEDPVEPQAEPQAEEEGQPDLPQED